MTHSVYPSVNTIVFMLSAREVYRPVMFSQNEVFCGPDCETVIENGKYKTIQTPPGYFDIQTILRMLPMHQYPELVVVKTDATRRLFPSGLQSVKCPKVLVCGDTHHLTRAIQTLMCYADKERFDYILSEHDRQHLHFFTEAGYSNVYWLPALNVNPKRQERRNQRHYAVSFVGQVGKWHPYRHYILSQLAAAGIGVQVLQTTQENAARVYADSLINLNISLNGDINLRVFEILASGGFLLTDRLGNESGFSLLFTEGVHCVTFTNEHDLKEKINYYSHNAHKAKKIAIEGEKVFWSRHDPRDKVWALTDLIFNDVCNDTYLFKIQKRHGTGLFMASSAIQRRISIYEYFQEQHRIFPSLNALLFPQIDLSIMHDIGDLPRLTVTVGEYDCNTSGLCNQDIRNDSVDNYCTRIPFSELVDKKVVWDIIVITDKELTLYGIETFCAHFSCSALIVENGENALGVLFQQQLEKLGMKKESLGNGYLFTRQDPLCYGEQLIEQNRLIEAFSWFKRLLQIEPVSARVFYNLGIISLKIKDIANAEYFLSHACQIDAADYDIVVELLQVYATLNQPQKAHAVLQRAIAFAKNDIRFLNALGMWYEQQEAFEEAIQTYNKSLVIKKDQHGIGEKLSILQQKQKEACAEPAAVAMSERKRILIVNNLYPPQELGGYTRLLYDFAQILQQRGHCVHVLTSDTSYLGKAPAAQREVSRTLELFGEWKHGVTRVFPSDRIRSVTKKNLQVLQSVIHDFSPQVCLFGNVDFIGYQLIHLLLNANIPIIHHLGNHCPGYPLESTPHSALYRLATASSWLREEVWRAGYPLQIIDVVYPGAQVTYFHDPAPKKLDQLRIAYASIVLPYKGIHILINALLHLKDAGIDFTAAIAGTTTDENFVAQLKELCKKTGIDSSVSFVGFQDHHALKKLYADHNVLVFPSIAQEAFGITQVEAMAAGLLVITSATGGAQEIVEHDKSGIVFQSENCVSLAQALLRIKQDPVYWEQLRRAGQNRVIEKFDIAKSIDVMENIFDDLIKQKYHPVGV